MVNFLNSFQSENQTHVALRQHGLAAQAPIAPLHCCAQDSMRARIQLGAFRKLFFMQRSLKKRGKGGWKCNAGFTLVELLVSMSLFALVSVVALGSVVTTSDLARSAQAKRSVIDNVSFALEAMSRKIKVGTNYHCDLGSLTDRFLPNPCPVGKDSFGFLASNGTTHVEYKLLNGAIVTGSCPVSSCGSGPSFVALTSPDVTIDKLSFFAATNGVPVGDGFQPIILVLVQGTVLDPKKQTPTTFVIQTTLSQRVLEN